MFKLIAIDIDGTLIDRQGKIPAINKKTIKIAQAQGYLVALNTGRSFHSAKKYADELNLSLPIVAANGTLIRDPKTLEVYSNLNFDKKTKTAIAHFLDSQKGIYCQAYHLDGIVTSGVGLLGLVKFSSSLGKLSFKKIKEMYNEYKICNIKKHRALEKEVPKLDIHKFFVACKKEDAQRLEEKLKDYNCIVENHYEGQNGYLEIIPKGASKGEGLKFVAQMYNVSLEETIAIGDSANDVSMFKVAGFPVAMCNGTEYAKKHAMHITFSNNDNGVAAVIKEFMLTPVKDFKFIQKTGTNN